MKLPDFISFEPLNKTREQMQATPPEKPLALPPKRKPKSPLPPYRPTAGDKESNLYGLPSDLRLNLRWIKLMLLLILLLLVGNLWFLWHNRAPVLPRLDVQQAPPSPQVPKGYMLQYRRRPESGFYPVPVLVPQGQPQPSVAPVPPPLPPVTK